MQVDAKLRDAAALAAIGLVSFASAAQAQLPASAFQAYTPADAATVTPGLYSLYSVPLDSLVPTQSNVGFAEVNAKVAAYNLLPSTSALTADLLGTVEPVVIGPGGTLYQTDGHHSFVALLDSKFGASDPTVYVDVIGNYSADTPTQFASALAAATQLYPFDNGVQKTVVPTAANPLSPLPASLGGLTNDAYRGLEYSVLKNKGSAGVGHDKTPGYSDFMWADAYRNALTASGAGLATLTPGDANAAAAWSLVGTNKSSIPGYGTVSVNQLPGYILPTGGSVTLTGVLNNAELGTGALDGSNSGTIAASAASFTGINGYTSNGIVVQPHLSGLVMQLGADDKSTVTLAGTANTYTGGTTLIAGTLVAASDGSLGAAPTGAAIDPNNVANSVRAANGIVFASLSEGNATLQFGTGTGGTFATARNISIGQETANFDMHGNTVTLTGQIASSDLNTSGVAPLTVNDSIGTGTLVLAPSTGSNALFHGNLQISAGTLQVSSDAAMGATTGPSYEIGQIDLDGGTLKAGASFSSVRSVFLSGGSTYDTNGFATSYAGSLTDTQRTLKVINSGTSAGSVSFGGLDINATATLAPDHGTSAGVSVNLNGITRGGDATLFLAPKSGTLGTTEKVFSSGASTSLTNGMVAPWIIIDSGGSASSSPYSFATYGSNGYVTATAGSTNITTSSASQLVQQGSNATLTSNGQAYALELQSGKTITVGSGKTLTLGDGSDPAGLILNSTATITGGTLAFGGSEGVIYAKGSTTNSNAINSVISGSGGITLSGSGNLNLNAASTNTGAVTIDSGTLTLNVANALAASSGVNLLNVKSSPSNAVLAVNYNNTLASLNSAGNNSSIVLAAGKTLTISDASTDVSTYSGGITDSSAASGVAGALTKAGLGLLDLSGGSSKGIALNAGSTIALTGGQLRLSTNELANANTFTLSANTELQFEQGGTGAFAGNITGAGLVHVESGILQLTGTGNTYTGGTTLEIGTTLLGTTATLSQAAGQTITNAGGQLVLDQATSGNFTAIMKDGQAAGQGPILSGSLVKDDSSGGNGGNVTIANAQQYSGATTVEAGTLTLGATNAVAASSGVTLGRVGGGATANLALGADNTLQGLNSTAGDTTGVQLNGHALTVAQAAGTTSSFGGSISDTGAGSLNKTGAGTLALSGATTIGGNLEVGAGTLSQTGGSLSVGGTVVNNATLSVSGATATYGGTFTNNGLLISDPSTQSFATLSVSAIGAIQASTGDVYQISGSFLNASTQATTWNTSGATLEFVTGASSAHTLQLTGRDLGAIWQGYDNNFAWGTLKVDADNSVTLADGLSPGSAVALHVTDMVGAEISGDTITNIIGDGFNIYYNGQDAADAYLRGLNYALAGGGELIADVPEPASLVVLLSGVVGILMGRRRRG